jgi:hypothetical protein
LAHHLSVHGSPNDDVYNGIWLDSGPIRTKMPSY